MSNNITELIVKFFISNADENEGKIKVCKVNVDEEPDLAEKFGVMSIPTFVAIKDGEVLETSIGIQDEEEILKMFDK